MRVSSAAAGSAAFFVLAPCTVAGLLPWWISGWDERVPMPYGRPVQVIGALLVAAGAAILLLTFVRFVLHGRGTPAPVAPTEHLVVQGIYRHIRNPMYVAVVSAILGQAIMFSHIALLWYAVVAGSAMFAFARWHEEPALRRRFGDAYDEYRRAVPAWWPRLRPWRPDGRC